MTRFDSKICILGDFAVGKTSTVERFVNNHFSEKYLTTIGVKIDTKEISLPDNVILKLIIWDTAGTDEFGELQFAYLRGASGYILVADGTRPQTINSVIGFKEQAEARYGEVPIVFLLNKSDLQHTWEVSNEQQQWLRESFNEVYVTSAKTGDNVADAIETLGSLIAAREFGRQ